MWVAQRVAAFIGIVKAVGAHGRGKLANKVSLVSE